MKEKKKLDIHIRLFIIGLSCVFSIAMMIYGKVNIPAPRYENVVIVAAQQGLSSGNTPRMEWVWSVKRKNGEYEDKLVSFSTFSRFKIGDVVQFAYTEKTKYGSYIEIGFLILAFSFSWLIIEFFIWVDSDDN